MHDSRHSRQVIVSDRFLDSARRSGPPQPSELLMTRQSGRIDLMAAAFAGSYHDLFIGDGAPPQMR
jgi:hypothetical protein